MSDVIKLRGGNVLQEIDQAIHDYQNKWHSLIAGCHNTSFFRSLKPVAVGWKVADRAEYNRVYAELHEDCDRIVETWMNGRWIAKMHLRNSKLNGGIEIIKLMERRPNSTDAVGLDHLDFYSPEVTRADQILQNEPTLKWSHESNDVVDDYDWISVWFANTEAKLKAGTVIDIVIKELSEINDKIKQSS